MLIVITDHEQNPGFALDASTAETIQAQEGETEAAFLKRIQAWLAVREQQRRRERKAE